MVALTVAGQLISLFFVMFLGYFMGRRALLNAVVVKGFSTYVTQVGIPIAMVFSMQQPFSWDSFSQLGLISLGLTISILVGIFICLPICKAKKLQKREAGVWLSCAGFSNAVFIGRPIMLGLYGQAALFASSALMFVFNILCYSLGSHLISGGEGTSLKQVLWSLVKNKVIISGGIGLVLFLCSISLPGPLLTGMSMVNDTLTPITMLVIGYSLSQAPLKELFSDSRVYIVSAVRLILCPLVTILLMRLLISDPTILGVMCIAAATPTASTVSVLCEQYDNNTVLASKITFGTTLLCVVTIPLIMMVVERLM